MHSNNIANFMEDDVKAGLSSEIALTGQNGY
jgi:hypothetical protein